MMAHHPPYHENNAIVPGQEPDHHAFRQDFYYNQSLPGYHQQPQPQYMPNPMAPQVTSSPIHHESSGGNIYNESLPHFNVPPQNLLLGQHWSHPHAGPTMTSAPAIPQPTHIHPNMLLNHSWKEDHRGPSFSSSTGAGSSPVEPASSAMTSLSAPTSAPMSRHVVLRIPRSDNIKTKPVTDLSSPIRKCDISDVDHASDGDDEYEAKDVRKKLALMSRRLDYGLSPPNSRHHDQASQSDSQDDASYHEGDEEVDDFLDDHDKAVQHEQSDDEDDGDDEADHAPAKRHLVSLKVRKREATRSPSRDRKRYKKPRRSPSPSPSGPSESTRYSEDESWGEESPEHEFQNHFTSAAHAAQYLSGRNCPDRNQKLPISNDDWKTYANSAMRQECSRRMFEALLQPFEEAPAHIQEHGAKAINHYITGQNKFLAIMRDLFENEEERLSAEAQCVLAVDQIIHIHRAGILNRDVRKALVRKALKPELDLRCSERMEMVIDYVRRNKLVAKDVIEGNFRSLVNSPKAFRARKLENVLCNDRKRRGRERGNKALQLVEKHEKKHREGKRSDAQQR